MPTEPRKMQSLRISPDALDRLNTLAERQGRTRAAVLRRCLARGLAAEEADLDLIAEAVTR